MTSEKSPAARVFHVARQQQGMTLGALLRIELSPLSWSRARQLVEGGRVSIDEVEVRDPARRVSVGEAVRVATGSPRAPHLPRVTIVYEDADLVVIDKPAGVSSVPYDRGERGTAMHQVRAQWRRRERPLGALGLRVVHRIDKDTSGLLMFAKTRSAERLLAALLRDHAIERRYLTVAHGRLTDRRIESRLVTDRGDGLRGSTRHRAAGKPAVTHVAVRERFPAATLCEVRLETGRTHQIRIHLAESGHPVVGERVYARDYRARGNPLIPCSRLLLHAASLAFRHPVTRERLVFESPLPAEFQDALEILRRRRP
jgi:23S rRNA pseudouridine1911/1915/1917 synthase